LCSLAVARLDLRRCAAQAKHVCRYKMKKYIPLFLLLISDFARAEIDDIAKVDCRTPVDTVKACVYTIGESLKFRIIGIGTDTASIHFIKSDQEGTYYGVVDSDTHCVRVVGGKRHESSGGTFATVSTENGRLLDAKDDENCTVKAGIKKHNRVTGGL
jgi:hypothetical protein